MRENETALKELAGKDVCLLIGNNCGNDIVNALENGTCKHISKMIKGPILTSEPIVHAGRHQFKMGDDQKETPKDFTPVDFCHVCPAADKNKDYYIVDYAPFQFDQDIFEQRVAHYQATCTALSIAKNASKVKVLLVLGKGDTEETVTKYIERIEQLLVNADDLDKKLIAVVHTNECTKEEAQALLKATGFTDGKGAAIVEHCHDNLIELDPASEKDKHQLFSQDGVFSDENARDKVVCTAMPSELKEFLEIIINDFEQSHLSKEK